MAIVLSVLCGMCGMAPMTAEEGGNAARESGGAAKQSATADDFPVDLFQEVAKGHASDNVLVSPLSISTALTMTLGGAAGDTKKDMLKVLGFPDDAAVDTVASQAGEVLSKLRSPGSNTQLEIANALFGEKKVKFKPSFLSFNKKYFDAPITSLDFKAPGAVKTINGWVSEKTHEKIPTIIDKIGDDAILYLINAIYFKGTWENKFDKSATKPGDFQLTDGTTRKVAMMNMRRDDFRYFESNEVQVINLPYADGRLSMYVLLPSKNLTLSAFEAQLSKQKWNKYRTGVQKREGKLALPRFKIEDKMKLKEILSNMGMKVAFDQNRADFGPMASETKRIYISQVFHKTFMEVNEEGTEAAAVTAVEMGVKGAMFKPMVPPFVMNVDRPFMLALYDRTTGRSLFMGHVANPPPAK
jgi:serpin B